MKCTQSQYKEVGSRQKRIRWKPAAEAPSKETSTSGVEPKPTHSGSEENEDFEILLHVRSRRTRGPAVVTVEVLLGETTEMQVTRDEPLPALVPIRIVSLGSLQGQGKDILPGSPVEMMPSARVQ